jgi:DNA polymerase/3'-5' exonuclease PolX
MENGTNKKQQFSFICCKRKTETANFHMFAGNKNGKRKFVILARQKLNGNRRLLFQLMCLSILE